MWAQRFLLETPRAAAPVNDWVATGTPVMKGNGTGNRRFAIVRDLQDHLIAGRIDFFDLGIYLTIHWQADFATGVWWGSAAKLHATGAGGFSLRHVQRSLQTLRAIGFLAPFHKGGPRGHKHGQRGNYPVLLNKYRPLSGALRGKWLNAAASTDWRHPVYEPCGEGDTDHDALRDAQQPPVQYSVPNSQNKDKKNPAAKPAPPADPRRQPFLNFASNTYKDKHSTEPLWQGKDHSALKRLLNGQPAERLPLDRLNQLWTNYTASTEPFIVRQGDSLAYFCTNVDKFLDGPLLAAARRGTNAKPTATDVATGNWAGLGLNRPPN
jgi:hypothetical protein